MFMLCARDAEQDRFSSSSHDRCRHVSMAASGLCAISLRVILGILHLYGMGCCRPCMAWTGKSQILEGHTENWIR